MLTMKHWPRIEKAYKDTIAEIKAARKEEGIKVTERMRDVMDEYGMDNGRGDVFLPFRQVWGRFLPKIIYDCTLGEDYSCPHMKDRTVGHVLVLMSEGGRGSAGICLDCLVEWVERNCSRIWKGEGGDGAQV